jgi:hypothetical protein
MKKNPMPVKVVTMPDTRKEQERAELHRVIWNIANDLRGIEGNIA